MTKEALWGHLGLDVDYADKISLKVVKVKAGLIEDWNKANPDNAVKSSDKILSINGVSGDNEKMLEQVKLTGEMKLVMQRPSEIDLTIVKDVADQSIGLDVDSNIVKVLKVKEGPVNTYNSKLSKDQQDLAIKPGDKFIMVNGITTLPELVKELKSNKTLNIRILREA